MTYETTYIEHFTCTVQLKKKRRERRKKEKLSSLMMMMTMIIESPWMNGNEKQPSPLPKPTDALFLVGWAHNGVAQPSQTHNAHKAGRGQLSLFTPRRVAALPPALQSF